MKRKARAGDNSEASSLDESPTFGRALAATADPMAFLRAVQASQLAHPSGSNNSDHQQASKKQPPVPVQAAHSLFIEGQLLLPPGHAAEKMATAHAPPATSFSSAQPPHPISSANSEPTSPDLVAFLQGVPFKVGDNSEPASPLSPELLAGLANGLQGHHHSSSHDGLLPSAHGLFSSGMERLTSPDSARSVGAESFTIGVNGVGSTLTSVMGRSTSPGFSAESVFIDEVTDDSSGHSDNDGDDEDGDVDDGTASEYAESLGLDDPYRSFDDDAADASSDYSYSRDDQDDVDSLLDNFGAPSAPSGNLETSGLVPTSMSALSLQGFDLSPGLVGGGGFQQTHSSSGHRNNKSNSNSNARRRSNSSCSSASSSGVVALSRTVSGSSKGRHRAPSAKVREAEETTASLLARGAAQASANASGGRSSNRSGGGKRRKVSPDARKPPVAETSNSNSNSSSDDKDASSAARSKSRARPSRSQGAAAKKALNLEALKSQIASLQAKEQLHANRPKLGAHASATLRKQDAAAAAATATALSTEAADVRRSVVAAFFQLRTSRGGASTDATTWAELVNGDSFTLTLPRTPYRAVPTLADAKAKAAAAAVSCNKGQAGSKAVAATDSGDKAQELPQEQVKEGSAEATASESSSSSGRVLKGIPSLVADCASLASLADGLRAACRSRYPEANKGGRRSTVHSVGLKYELESSSEEGGSSSSGLLAQGDVLMGSWRGSTMGVAACAEVEAAAAAASGGTAPAGGAKVSAAAATKVEATVEGMVRCRFDDSHKLVAVELTFDAASFSRQLQKLGLGEASRLGQAHRNKRSNDKAGSSGTARNAANSSSGGAAGGASSAGLLAPSGFAGLSRPALGSRSSSAGNGGARPGTLPLPPLSAMSGLASGAPGSLLLAPALIGGANGGAPSTATASGSTNLLGPLPSAAFMRDFARATQLARAECGNQTPSPQQVHLQLLALQMQAVGQQQQQPPPQQPPVQVPSSAQGPDLEAAKPASLTAAPAALAPHAPFPPSAFTEGGPNSFGDVKAIHNTNKRLKVVAASPRGCAVATPSPPSEATWSLAKGPGKLPHWPSNVNALASVAPATFPLPLTSSMPPPGSTSTESELLPDASRMAQ